MKIKDFFVKFTEENEIPMAVLKAAEGIPEHLGIMIQGEVGDWESYGMCFEAENLFVFFVNFGVQVPKENRANVCAYLNRINYQLKAGGIYMDWDSGNLMARTAQYIYGSDEEKAHLVEETIKISAIITDAYYKGIMSEAFKGTEDTKL